MPGLYEEETDSYWRDAEGESRWLKFVEMYAKDLDLYSNYKLNDKVEEIWRAGKKTKHSSTARVCLEMFDKKMAPYDLDYQYVYRVRRKKHRDKNAYTLKAIISYCLAEKVLLSDIVVHPSFCNGNSDQDANVFKPTPTNEDNDQAKTMQKKRHWYSFIFDFWDRLFRRHG